MPTTTPAFAYRAQTDPTIKTWHLGAAERGAACFCGVRLIEPDDTRAFALRVPAEKRNYETSPDVARVTCGSCKRTREYAKATGANAAADAEAGRAAEAAKAPSQRRRPSRTGKARAAQERDRERRDAAGQVAR
jgi:hypothetical protein